MPSLIYRDICPWTYLLVLVLSAVQSGSRGISSIMLVADVSIAAARCQPCHGALCQGAA
jgi:hypothetical protein